MVHDLSQPALGLGDIARFQLERLMTQCDVLAHDDGLRSLLGAVSLQRFGYLAPEYNNFEELRAVMRGAFDFRSRADGSYAERTDAEDFACDEAMAENIYRIAEGFGLTGDTIPEKADAKVALVLGGAARSPLNRTRYTQEMIDNGQLKVDLIAMLGSERPVDEAERSRGGEYAKDSKTEFELMVAAAEAVYGTKLKPEDVYEGNDPAVADNMPRHYKIAHIPANSKHPDIFIVSAPVITDPFEVRQGKVGARTRANTRDSYAVLARVANFQPGDRAVAVTNAHFRPFQGVDAAGQLASIGVESEIVGYDPKHYGESPKKANELLQEMLTAADSLAKASG